MKLLLLSFGINLVMHSTQLICADYDPQKTDELKQHLSQFEKAAASKKKIKIETAKAEFSEMIINLVNKRADPDVRTEMALNTALHYAAAAGDSKLIYFLWKRGVGINVKNDYGATPLIWAAFYGNRKAVALFIRLGADVNIEGDWTITPIGTALRNDDLGTITELLSAGAEVDMDDFKRTEGEAKQMLAACFSFREELLANETSLHRAIRLNYPDIASYVTSSNINQIDDNGLSALHTLLIKRSNENIILSLLASGANPSVGAINSLKLVSRVADWQISSQSKAKESSVFMVMLGYSDLKEVFLCSPEMPTETILLVIDFILNHGQIELDPRCPVN
jgi:ankyrin repeat protein